MCVFKPIKECPDLAYPVFGYSYDNSESTFINKVYELITNKCEQKQVTFLCQGTSMCMLASVLIYKLREAGYTADMTLYRKRGDNCHWGEHVAKTEPREDTYYVIVDDIISSGRSIENLFKQAFDQPYIMQVDLLAIGLVLEMQLNTAFGSRKDFIENCAKELYCAQYRLIK